MLHPPSFEASSITEHSLGLGEGPWPRQTGGDGWIISPAYVLAPLLLELRDWASGEPATGASDGGSGLEVGCPIDGCVRGCGRRAQGVCQGSVTLEVFLLRAQD